MLANYNHKVVTLEEAIVLGGHGYGFDALERCLMAGLREHFWGDTSTNTEHLLSEGMVYRLGLVVWKHLRLTQSESVSFLPERFLTRIRSKLRFSKIYLFIYISLSNFLINP